MFEDGFRLSDLEDGFRLSDTKIKYPLYLAVDLLLCTACNMTTAQDIAPARPPQAAADQQGMYISGKLSVATQQKRALQIQ